MPSVQRIGNALLLVFIVAPALAAQAPAGAADAVPARTRPARVVSGGKPWVVVYDHLEETMMVRDHKGREQSTFHGATLADGPVIRIPPDRPVEVRVVNANPMLYSYDVTGTVVQERRARGCRAMLGTFAQAGLQFRALSLGEMPSRGSMDTAMQSLMSAEALASGDAESRRGLPGGAEERAATIALVAAQVVAFEDTARSLSSFTSAVNDSIAVVAELADASASGPLLDALAESIRSRLPGVEKATDVPLSIRSLAQSAQRPATVLMQLAMDGDSDIRDIRMRFDSSVTSIARSYRRLQGQLYRVEQYRKDVEQRWTLDPSGDYRAIRVRMVSTGDFEEIPRFKAGTVEALTNPTGRLTCNMAPGLALTSNPRAYELRNDTIVQSSSTEQRAAAALLLHFDVADFTLPIGALAGVGLGTQRRPDWYLGASFRLSEVVRINAGAIWQREERLRSGWAVGEALPPDDSAGFEDKPRGYKPSLFWGISLVP